MKESRGRRRARMLAAVSLGLAASGALAPLPGQEDTALELTAVRFYRPLAHQTAVEVFCQVPLASLGALAGGSHEVAAAYRVAVSVRDSASLELLRQSWGRIVDGSLLGLAGAASAEHFQFAASPGRYVVEVAITDSASGHVMRQHAVVTAYSQAPGASDLVVVSGLRPAGRGDTTARAGEFQRGSVFLETSGRPVATSEQARLGYYLELYTARAETLSVAGRVVDAAGKQLVATSTQGIAVPVGGGVTSAMLDLSGLPPGGYRLELVLDTPDSQVVRGAPFRISTIGRRLAEAPAPGGAGPGASDSLGRLTEARLDSMYAPLVYLMGPGEQGVYPPLTVDGKRAFLRQFWAKRDPTPGTAENEFEAVFYRTVAEANRRFHEGGASAAPGWRTDRGRIFIRYGAPDDVLDRAQAGSSRPYQVWKYSGRKAHRFIFLDTSLLGNYELIWTDERREPSRPDWQELLGPEALDDALRF